MPHPSGEQLEITFADQRAVVTEVGGGLRSYSVGEQALVDAYGADEMSASGRGQVLIPWPNRIGDGRYAFQGREHQLPINDHVAHAAIHGLVRWVAWSVVEREAQRVVVAHELHPQPGYPFALALRLEYALSAAGLRVSTSGDERRWSAVPVRRGSASVPASRLADGRHVDPAARRRQRARPDAAAGGGDALRPSRTDGPSARPGSTTASPTWSGTATVSRGSRSGARTPRRASRSGPTRPTRT